MSFSDIFFRVFQRFSSYYSAIIPHVTDRYHISCCMIDHVESARCLSSWRHYMCNHSPTHCIAISKYMVPRLWRTLLIDITFCAASWMRWEADDALVVGHIICAIDVRHAALQVGHIEFQDYTASFRSTSHVMMYRWSGGKRTTPGRLGSWKHDMCIAVRNPALHFENIRLHD